MAKIIELGSDAAFFGTDITCTFMPFHVWNGQPLSGGGLEVPNGHEVVPVAVELAEKFPGDRRYFCVDRHPIGHISFFTSYTHFAPFQDVRFEDVEHWDDDDPRITSPYFGAAELRYYLAHCMGNVQRMWWEHGIDRTGQAELHPGLASLPRRALFTKGMDPKCDSYSAVRDNLGRSTGAAETMWSDGVRVIVNGGLAGNVCAGDTSVDFAKRGFTVYHVDDMCRDVPDPALTEAMDRKLKEAGVIRVESSQLRIAA